MNAIPSAFHPPILHSAVPATTNGFVGDAKPINRSQPSWKTTIVRAMMVCAGSVAILLPAWLPNRPKAPLERGTVELLQVALLSAAAAVILGALSHAGAYRPVCRVLAFGLLAAIIGELEDFIFGILKWPFPEGFLVVMFLAAALFTALRHRRTMFRFFTTAGSHASAGLIGAALIINYVFNQVIGSRKFWKAALGPDFSPEVPYICRSYLELLACYFIFVGIVGFAITLARRPEPI